MDQKSVFKGGPGSRKRTRETMVAGGPEVKRRREVVVWWNVPRPIRWGRRSRHDGQAWTCKVCGHLNKPSKYLLVDLPAFKCRTPKCKGKKHVNFKFNYGDLRGNGVDLIGAIKDQMQTGYCQAFALAMACEITVRVTYLLSRKALPLPTFEPTFLLADHFNKMGDLGLSKLPKFDSFDLMKQEILALKEAEAPDFSSNKALASMADILVTKGIYDMRYRRRFKVQSFERVENDFESISAALASGYPLVTDMIPGEFFEVIDYAEVYRAPYNMQTMPLSGATGHEIVLVGARRSKDADYYFFVNSYGKHFCERVKSGRPVCGGIGRIRASDICSRPYQFFRCVVDKEN